jgi:hypothetical protein
MGKNRLAAIFSIPRLRSRRQKARFLPPAPPRSYARTGDFLDTAPGFRAARSAVFAARVVA